MTSEGNGKIANINKPKALSAVAVAAPGYPAVVGAMSWLHQQFPAWDWLTTNNAHHIIGAIVAGAMAAMAAYRTKDTSEEPTKWQQKKDAKLDQKVAASLNRLNGNGNDDH